MIMKYLLTVFFLLLVQLIDSFTISFVKDVIDFTQNHLPLTSSLTSSVLSYQPPPLPLAPLVQPSFEDLRSYAAGVMEIVKSDVTYIKYKLLLLIMIIIYYYYI